MSWQQWLAQRKVHLHTPSKQELEGLRALIARDLADAALPALSADRRARRVSTAPSRAFTKLRGPAAWSERISLDLSLGLFTTALKLHRVLVLDLEEAIVFGQPIGLGD
jgi:hypothetical protein